LIKRRLNVILTKFKRYSKIISMSPSPKTLHWNSPGGGTASFVLSFYRHYPWFIIPLHCESYFYAVSICEDIWRKKHCALYKSFFENRLCQTPLLTHWELDGV